MITADTTVSNVVITATNGTYTYKTTMNGTTATIVINRPGTYTLTHNSQYIISTTSINIQNYGQVENVLLSNRIYLFKNGIEDKKYLNYIYAYMGDGDPCDDGAKIIPEYTRYPLCLRADTTGISSGTATIKQSGKLVLEWYSGNLYYGSETLQIGLGVYLNGYFNNLDYTTPITNNRFELSVGGTFFLSSFDFRTSYSYDINSNRYSFIVFTNLYYMIS